MGDIISLDAFHRGADGAWSSWERKQISRLKAHVATEGRAPYWVEGATDDGAPWLAGVDGETDDVIVHLARINGDYVLLEGGLTLIAASRRLPTAINARISPVAAAQAASASAPSKALAARRSMRVDPVSVALAFALALELTDALRARRAAESGAAAGDGADAPVPGGPDKAAADDDQDIAMSPLLQRAAQEQRAAARSQAAAPRAEQFWDAAHAMAITVFTAVAASDAANAAPSLENADAPDLEAEPVIALESSDQSSQVTALMGPVLGLSSGAQPVVDAPETAVSAPPAAAAELASLEALASFEAPPAEEAAEGALFSQTPAEAGLHGAAAPSETPLDEGAVEGSAEPAPAMEDAVAAAAMLGFAPPPPPWLVAGGLAMEGLSMGEAGAPPLPPEWRDRWPDDEAPSLFPFLFPPFDPAMRAAFLSSAEGAAALDQMIENPETALSLASFSEQPVFDLTAAGDAFGQTETLDWSAATDDFAPDQFVFDAASLSDGRTVGAVDLDEEAPVLPDLAPLAPVLVLSAALDTDPMAIAQETPLSFLENVVIPSMDVAELL